jgi:oligoribonuclease
MENTTDKSFVWIDLEMTGLDPNHDVILEIATVITTAELTNPIQGPHCVIHQPDAILNTMNPWCIEQHTASGLTDAVKGSTTTLQQAEEQTLAFIKQHCSPQSGLLAGNSVWQDKIFLQNYMSSITDYLFYRIIDVTTLKELIRAWYPDHEEFKKDESHRALDDIKKSIAELHYYKTTFFNSF